ncbi:MULTISPECIES: hypothetical protein [Pseudomonas]|uniref:Uncharacterized protein n=1 Tax=Pseudomonas lutea TaxID=243924 RepID=A0A9X8MHH5_9PSED|nr:MULTISPECIES: hypothetical protein [Pseudomonas]SER43329.1 hypothetical protein SAMN05216409_1217 [Pseudomonas lutea]
MSAEILARAIGSAPEIIEGIRSGLYTVWGGVVRVTKGYEGAGQIVGHLQFPGDTQQAQQAIDQLTQRLGGIQGSVDALQQGLNVLQSLQTANLALSGLNLAVSVAGFAIVCSKLNKISDQLASQSAKINQLVDLAVEAKEVQQLRDTARFRSAVKTIRQFAEMGDIEGLKGQIGSLHEQYEFTKLVLERSASRASSRSFLTSLELLQCLQERMMYLGFLQSFVQQKTGAPKFAIEALRELQTDWLAISTVIVDSVAANESWVAQLTQAEADNIVSLLRYRKEAMPALEYQASLLEFVAKRPGGIELLSNDTPEIRFIAA